MDIDAAREASDLEKHIAWYEPETLKKFDPYDIDYVDDYNSMNEPEQEGNT